MLARVTVAGGGLGGRKKRRGVRAPHNFGKTGFLGGIQESGLKLRSCANAPSLIPIHAKQTLSRQDCSSSNSNSPASFPRRSPPLQQGASTAGALSAPATSFANSLFTSALSSGGRLRAGHTDSRLEKECARTNWGSCWWRPPLSKTT